MNGAVTRRQSVLGCLLAALTLTALCITFAPAEDTQIRLMPFSAVWGLSFAGLWLLYRSWLKQPKPLHGLLLWLLAALFAAVMTLAASYARTGTMELLTESAGSMRKAALYFAGRVPLYFSAMRLLQDALAGGGAKAKALSVYQTEHGSFTVLGKGMDRFAFSRWLLPTVAAMLLVCWLPYFLCTFPGVVSNDSITQLTEIFGIKALSNGNPVFQTFLISLCVHAGALIGGADASIALYCTVQSILMALLLAYTLQIMLQSGASRLLTAVAFLFYAFCPIFPLFALCVGKDTSFAMAVLYFSLMVWRILCLGGGKQLPARRTLGLCLATALVALLRNPGVYLAGLTLIALCLWTFQKAQNPQKHKLWLAPACALGMLMGVLMVLHMAVLPLLNAEPMPETEEFSLPLQQVARVTATDPQALTSEERASIAAVLDFDRIKDVYNGELSDPIKFLWNENARAEQKSAFFRTWLSLLPKHPATYFSATFHNTYGYLCPGYLSTIKPTLLIGKQGHTSGLAGLFDFSINPRSDALSSAMDALSGQPLFRVLISPGLYGWVTLFAAAVILSSRSKRFLLAAVPSLFTLAGCLLSAVNGYFRYALPLYFCAPLLLALCVQALHLTTHKGEKTNEITDCAPLL